MVHQTCTSCARNCSFPSVPEKVEQLLSKTKQKKGREIPHPSVKQQTARLVWVFGVPHGALLCCSKIFLRKDGRREILSPCPAWAGSCLLGYTMHSPDCAPRQGPHCGRHCPVQWTRSLLLLRHLLFPPGHKFQYLQGSSLSGTGCTCLGVSILAG